LWDVLRKLFFRREHSQATASGRLATHDVHRFYYPKKGAGVLGESLAREIEDLGGTIEPSVQVTHIDANVREIYYQTRNGPELVAYDELLSTIPLKSFLNLLSPSPPHRILSLVDKLKHRALLLICLCVNRESVIGPFWIYFTSQLFNRLSEFNKFSADVVPSGKTGLCLEIGCNLGDELYSADDAAICRRVVGELEELDLLTAEDVEAHHVIREPFAYPIYHVDYRRDVQELMDWISSRGGLHTAGRQGAFLYINQDQALDCGREAAQQILQSVRENSQPAGSLVGAAISPSPAAEVGGHR
jgi:protoporphyrinogen oxidase